MGGNGGPESLRKQPCWAWEAGAWPDSEQITEFLKQCECRQPCECSGYHSARLAIQRAAAAEMARCLRHPVANPFALLDPRCHVYRGRSDNAMPTFRHDPHRQPRALQPSVSLLCMFSDRDLEVLEDIELVLHVQAPHSLVWKHIHASRLTV